VSSPSKREREWKVEGREERKVRMRKGGEGGMVLVLEDGAGAGVDWSSTSIEKMR
jgi:hypothetical protein